MPLDTEPLNTTRRALLVSVLLVLFLGSLGLAQWITSSRRSVLGLSLWFPPEFPTALTLPIPGLDAARDGVVDGEPRRVYCFFYEHVPANDVASLAAEARLLYATTLGEIPHSAGIVEWSGHPAVQIQQMERKDGGFAIMRLTIVSDHVVAILYSGDTPATDADTRMFFSLVDHLRISGPGGRRANHNDSRGIR